MDSQSLTPKVIKEELDRYVIGQDDAKKAVAIALRNRWRRLNVKDETLRDDIIPKNILMIGPTGCGKTEIARKLAKDWRTDRYLRRLESMIIAADKSETYLISGTGDVLEPQEGIIAIGSGGNFALSAARALKRKSNLSAKEIAAESLKVAAELCIYTNDTLNISEIKI